MAVLDALQEARLERELDRQYHLTTCDDRLKTVAEDVVWHFLRCGFGGRTLMVSIDKARTIKLCDKVWEHWTAEGAAVARTLRLDLSPKTCG